MLMLSANGKFSAHVESAGSGERTEESGRVCFAETHGKRTCSEVERGRTQPELSGSRDGAPPAAERKSLFKPKSAQVLRVLLREPRRARRVIDLAQAADVSLGHVRNVRTGLLDREWARVSTDGLYLSAADTVLDASLDKYQEPDGRRTAFYTILHGRAFENVAAGVLSTASEAGNVVFASFSAAHWQAPFGRTGVH